MSYSPATDFLALLRQTADGVQSERMPGLDYVVSALARAGLFALSVGQTPPTANQLTTVWLKPALPSWTAEGQVFLWDTSTQAYTPATTAGWITFLSPSGYSFQAAAVFTNVVAPDTSIIAIERNGPSATTLLLPLLSARKNNKTLQVVDWSVAFTNHVITLTPSGGASIMREPTWSLLSTPNQLASVNLRPCPDLNAWIIAP